MPLEVQDVEWSETARCVLLRVPLRGAQLKNVDIFTANTYVKALNLYDPPVEANIQARCRVYSRRGAAYMELEEYIQALRDYEAAIKLNPRNEALKTDAYKIRKIIQGEESTE